MLQLEDFGVSPFASQPMSPQQQCSFGGSSLSQLLVLRFVIFIKKVQKLFYDIFGDNFRYLSASCTQMLFQRVLRRSTLA